MHTHSAPKIVGPGEGKAGSLGSIGVRFMVDTEETHAGEDEYSYVLEGRMGALLGDDVVYAEVGDLVHKPRNQWHTFWNAGDEPAYILEIISPAGFERFFEELVDMGGVANADPDTLVELAARYGHEFQLDSVPELVERFDLVFPGEPVS